MRADLSSDIVKDAEMVDLTPDTIADYGVCGYKDISKHIEISRKVAWFRKYYPVGLRTKIILTKKDGYQGMIEYIPGEYAHRPVMADQYLFIHCLFVGFRNEYKGQGYASALIRSCIHEAKSLGKAGVAVVARKGSFMAGKEIFIKLGFEPVDAEKPDFDLLALRFDPAADAPKFIRIPLDAYQQGLTIIRSAQCPYSVKNVEAMLKTAQQWNIATRLIDADDADVARQTPCAFGTFCILYQGEVISHHPISNTRFENILQSKISKG